VVGKNYRLQNIQLSKIKPGPKPPDPQRACFATLKSRKSITSSLGRCATRAARSRKNRQQPSDGRRRAGDQMAPQRLTDNFSKIRRKLFRGRAVRGIALLYPGPAFVSGRPASPKPRHASARRRLVENTGLEPVTSWLQTRRSPS
jgi:hypothetical protein